MASDSSKWDGIQFPSSGDGDFWEMLKDHEIYRLRRLRDAILKWSEVAQDELEQYAKECETKRTPAWDQYNYDPVLEDQFMLLHTERALFASLSVSVTATTEEFFYRLCKRRNLPWIGKGGKSDFNIACQSIERVIQREIATLDGFGGNQRARKLNNCFKHNGGKTNAEFVAKYQGDLDLVISYEDEDWLGMIEQTDKMLTEIIKRLDRGTTSKRQSDPLNVETIVN